MLIILGAICTALLSGVIAAIATYSMNSNKEHVFLLRGKAEELFISLEKYMVTLSSHTTIHYSLFKGDVSRTDIMDYVIKQNKDDAFDSESGKKTKMIVSIYFPELEEDYNDMMRCLAKVNELIFKGNNLADASGGRLKYVPSMLSEYDSCVKALIASEAKLSVSIVRCARLTMNAEALDAPMIAAIKRRIKASRAISSDG